MKTYILFTGGKESLINLFTEVEARRKPILVFFSYGQISWRKEFQSLTYYSDKYKLKWVHIGMPLNVPPAIMRGTLDSNDQVVMRNVLFVARLMNQQSITSGRILIGCTKYTDKTYNDGATPFLNDLRKIVCKLYPNVEIDSHTKNIYGINTYRHLVGKDLSHIWFCSRDGEKPCGKCFKCRGVIEGTKKSGILANQFLSQIQWT